MFIVPIIRTSRRFDVLMSKVVRDLALKLKLMIIVERTENGFKEMDLE